MAIKAADAHDTIWGQAERAKLLRRLSQARISARTKGRRVIACVTLSIRADMKCMSRLMNVAASHARQAFYWADFMEQSIFSAIDSAIALHEQGPNAVTAVKSRWEDERSSLLCESTDRPRWFCGFSFDAGSRQDSEWAGWPDGACVLPRFLFEGDQNGDVSVTVCEPVDHETDAALQCECIENDLAALILEASVPIAAKTSDGKLTGADQEKWWEQVSKSAAEIREGRYAKVVMARKVVYDATSPYNVSTALERLREMYPRSITFAVVRNGSTFLGATPERLVGVQNSDVLIDCLAGTAQRGNDPAEDGRLGAELLGSEKNRSEHRAVLDGILMDIEGVVSRVQYPPGPGLRKLPNLQHLYTPVTGGLGRDQSILELVGRLHPTPAVAGLPKQVAKYVIADREPMDRGWYAGPIGWLDQNGDGSFAVALRSALIQGRRAILYAGAGIMGDSDPESEWQETQWKLRPMQAALGFIPE